MAADPLVMRGFRARCEPENVAEPNRNKFCYFRFAARQLFRTIGTPTRDYICLDSRWDPDRTSASARIASI
jgi:hypothetical protein